MGSTAVSQYWLLSTSRHSSFGVVQSTVDLFSKSHIQISQSPWNQFSTSRISTACSTFHHVQLSNCSSFSPRHRQGSHSASCSKSLHRTDNDPQSKGAKGCLERCFMAELNCVALGVCSLPDMNHVCRSVTHDEIETFQRFACVASLFPLYEFS